MHCHKPILYFISTELTLHLGYDDKPLGHIGLFVVDELLWQGRPDTLTIRARAADFKNSLKEQRTNGWHEISIESICTVIAAQHDLAADVSPALASKHINHIDQTEESDLHFLTRLARQYDAVSTIKAKRLIFSQKGQVSLDTHLVGDSKPTDLTSYRFTMPDRHRYVAAIAHWHNNQTGKREPVRVGKEGKPVYTVRSQQPDKESARIAAQSALKSLKRGTVTGELTLPGNTKFRAGGKLTLSNFRDEIDGDWIVTRVEHRLSRQGFNASASVESPKGRE